MATPFSQLQEAVRLAATSTQSGDAMRKGLVVSVKLMKQEGVIYHTETYRQCCIYIVVGGTNAYCRSAVERLHEAQTGQP